MESPKIHVSPPFIFRGQVRFPRQTHQRRRLPRKFESRDRDPRDLLVRLRLPVTGRRQQRVRVTWRHRDVEQPGADVRT